MRYVVTLMALALLLVPTACGRQDDEPQANGGTAPPENRASNRPDPYRQSPNPAPIEPVTVTGLLATIEPTAPPVDVAVVPATYAVQPGDTLSGIAQHFTGRSSRYTELQTHNRIAVATSIRGGDILKIPPEWRIPTGTTSPLTSTGTVSVGDPGRTTQIRSGLSADSPTPTVSAYRVIGQFQGKQFYVIPSKAELAVIQRSVAAGREKWRTDPLQVAEIELDAQGISAPIPSLWAIHSADKLHQLTIFRIGQRLTLLELEQKNGIWYPATRTETAIPNGFSIEAVDRRDRALGAALMKGRVRWQ